MSAIQSQAQSPEDRDRPAHAIYLPIISVPRHEVRALWISRFDLGSSPNQQARLEYLIDRAAAAGFNTVLLQVRATGDAYYSPGLEPWSYRLTSSSPATLGIDPGWDPLATAIRSAHARGLELHAYVNLYSAWECGRGEPPHASPEHQYWSLAGFHPDPYTYDPGWRVHIDTPDGPAPMSVEPSGVSPCSEYLWSSPGVERVEQHNLAVVLDIASRYAVDGIHLDRARYPGRKFSADPESILRWQASDPSVSFEDWQRNNLSGTIARLHAAVKTIRPQATVSAAVWFTYKKTAAMGFPTSQGYYDYFQDSHRWLRDGSLDAMAPMIYGTTFNNDIGKWRVLADDHLSVQGNQQVWLGMGAAIAPFDGIAERIAYARAIGARGVAVWSAGAVDSNGYWDDFRSGPFSDPAFPR